MKKILALLLCVSLLFVMIAACGNNSDPGGGPPIETGPGPVVNPGGDGDDGEEEDAPPTFVAPNYSLPDKEADVYRTKDGKRHIIIGGAYDRYYDSTHEDIWVSNPANPETAQMSFDVLKEVEARYNVFIEFINMTWEGISENIPISIMSGLPDADAYFTDTQIVIPAVLNNMATGLEDLGLPSDHDVFKLSGNTVMKSMKIPGQDKTYMFTAARANQDMYMIGYNKDMIAAHGLIDPQERWDLNEWTWETFREYCRVLTDTSQDIYGWSGFWTNFLQGLLFSNNAAFAPGPVQTIDSPNSLEVLNFLNELYNVDRTARPWNPDDWGINNDLYIEGKSAFWISVPWINQGNVNDGNFTFELGMVPFPIGPNGNKDTMPTQSVEGGYYFIPRYIAQPREVFDVIYDLTNWFKGDLDYRDDMDWVKDMVMTDENFKYYMEVNGRTGFELAFVLGFSASVDGMFEQTNGPPIYTPAQYVEIYRQVYQDALDNYFK